MCTRDRPGLRAAVTACPRQAEPHPHRRASADNGGQQHTGVLGVFIAALRTVPFILPTHWAYGRLWDDLPAYAIHAEGAMRAVSRRECGDPFVVCWGGREGIGAWGPWDTCMDGSTLGQSSPLGRA